MNDHQKCDVAAVGVFVHQQYGCCVNDKCECFPVVQRAFAKRRKRKTTHTAHAPAHYLISMLIPCALAAAMAPNLLRNCVIGYSLGHFITHGTTIFAPEANCTGTNTTALLYASWTLPYRIDEINSTCSTSAETRDRAAKLFYPRHAVGRQSR